jgi:hypothetical protein
MDLIFLLFLVVMSSPKQLLSPSNVSLRNRTSISSSDDTPLNSQVLNGVNRIRLSDPSLIDRYFPDLQCLIFNAVFTSSSYPVYSSSWKRHSSLREAVRKR